MSMYGLVFGESSAKTTCLTAIGLTESDFYRFRDAYLSEDGNVAVYTRGGGNNRVCYACTEIEDGRQDPDPDHMCRQDAGGQ
jgi:hypothetical protein